MGTPLLLAMLNSEDGFARAVGEWGQWNRTVAETHPLLPGSNEGPRTLGLICLSL